MKNLSIIAVFDKEKENVLMCKRVSNPYKGKYNFVGGKQEANESMLKSAYRELFEETGITKQDISLSHLMNFEYIEYDFKLFVYYGVLNKSVTLVEEKHPLHWVSKDENFFDINKFAGEGNIGHIVSHISL